jgi:DNA-binding NtrC family response regulator
MSASESGSTGEGLKPRRRVVHDAPLLEGSPQMDAIRTLIADVADTDAAVMIRGESGVGKDLVARAIHAASLRGQGPFIKVNCAAIPAGLLESELLGHERGAFTGAHQRKQGQLEHAHHGTIFLDEVGDLPLALQAKILHVLQDFRFSRVGGHEVIKLDTRVIAATNVDLEGATARGAFRTDLYYRLNVVEVRIPPLRERKAVIPILVSHFLRRFNEQYGRRRDLAPETLARLTAYHWPGNVRELENVIRRMVLLPDAEQAFAPDAMRPADDPPRPAPVATQGLREIGYQGALAAEREALVQVLERVQWNRAEAARILKVNYKTLLNKISQLELAPRKS